jgi:hypothetical protein
MRRYTVRGYRYDIGSPMERLQELENKLEDGYLLEAPCKIGDTAYAVCEDLDVDGEFELYEYEVKGIYLNKDGWCVLDDSEIISELGTEWAILDRAEAERVKAEKECAVI